MIKSVHDEYKYIGKQTVRKDAYEIVQGKTVFLDDFSLADMLIGKAKECPYPNAKIISIDTSKAKALEGVHAVLTYKDSNPNSKFGWPPQKPVLGTHMRYVGDPVAIVAADTEVIAKAAIDLIEVEYEVLEPVFDVLEAQKDGAPQLYDEFPNNIVPGGFKVFQPNGVFWTVEKGDVEKGFEECAFVAEDTVSFGKKPSTLAPEPPGCIVKWKGGDDYHIWGTSQGIMVLQLSAAKSNKAHVEAQSFNVGGSYGNKTAIINLVQFGLLLAKATNRPVKLMETKIEQCVMHETRLGTTVQAKIGMDKDGIVRAVKGLWSVDVGSFCNTVQGQVSVGLGACQLIMAKCPNWDLDSRIVVTNKMPAGIVRGYGAQELNSCLALLITRAMREGNFEPVETFKRNYCKAGDRYVWRDGREWQARSINYDKAITEGAKKFRWYERWKGWGNPTWVSEDGQRVRGIGCSVTGNADVGESYTQAYVRMVPNCFDNEAYIMVHCNVSEIGGGQKSSILKMVAEILNVPYDHVDGVEPDSRISPRNESLGGSRGTITCGRAVCNAALDLKRQLFELAEAVLKFPKDNLELYNYGVRAKSKPDLWIPWRELLPNVTFETLTGIGRHIEDFGTPNIFMSFIEVEVDKGTGKVIVTDMLGATDCGQIIDPGSAEMQVHGGIGSASLDTAIYEENIIDPGTGRPMTYDMINSKWRPFNELPHMGISLEESQFDTMYFRAIGFGEVTGAAAAAAAMIAIQNAIGVEVKEYPATPDVILRALGKI